MSQWRPAQTVATGMAQEKLPKFKKPPVTEVLCCVYFQDLVDLHGPHLGALWAALGDEYKRIQTTAPLIPPDFSIASLVPFLTRSMQSEQYQLPRTLFINSDDTSLVQVQRDRLILNWKQQHKDNPYPSYNVVIADFKKIFDLFVEFIRNSRIGKLVLTGIELAYINHFLYGRELAKLSEIEKVLPLFSWHTTSNPVFKSLSAVNWDTQFEMPDGDGQLHFTVQTTQRRRDGESLLRSDFIARKLAPEIAFDSIWGWFDKAHVCIVTCFADITSPAVQQHVWERYQ